MKIRVERRDGLWEELDLPSGTTRPLIARVGEIQKARSEAAPLSKDLGYRGCATRANEREIMPVELQNLFIKGISIIQGPMNVNCQYWQVTVKGWTELSEARAIELINE